MTVGTRKFLSCVVVCVTECVTISARVGAGGPVSLLLVANSARSHLASRVRFAGWSVARVAIVVCREIRGNRQSRAAIDGRAVTAGATSLRARGAGVVLRVIKLDVEALVEARGKLFNGGLLLLMSVWQITHIGMAGVVNWLR